MQLKSQVEAQVKAVLGPTNTGKTHLAIERLCAHSSGAIGFPLRLLAREVYDRVCAIKGENRVALITGEERIEPRDARWLLCTVEAMPVSADLAFVALDEAQLGADRERGHIFTDRLLNMRGREETMLLGAATLEPMVRALVPEAEIVRRPRFSTLSHKGPVKLSRLPPRSAIVAFSAEQVYAIAEMLRRFRGGAAVVMGALSPQTRNAQVALYQSGEVDYLVATDAIGMGLNLDIDHVAFAGLSKFDGRSQRRLTPAEMAQIAGRAGRHQRDGTFGTLSGSGGHDAMFTDEEVHAIEGHHFAPLTKLFWRAAEPRFGSVDQLITDLEEVPGHPALAPAPEAIDLAILKHLAADADIAATLGDPARLARFWDACRLPDFRHQGTETHARFIARLWQDLRDGHLGADYVSSRIAELDNPAGDIDTLQGRIAAIRSWTYIAQRPDWVLAKAEMAARARSAEARLSDALHARLTERFVNRRTSVLLRRAGADVGLLPVRLDEDVVLVDGEMIGSLEGFRFKVDPLARHDDHRMLLAAAERHLPALLDARAENLAAAIAAGTDGLVLDRASVMLDGEAIAAVSVQMSKGKSLLSFSLSPKSGLQSVPEPARSRLLVALTGWVAAQFTALEPLRLLDAASRKEETGSDLRGLLIRLIDRGGIIPREGSSLDQLDEPQRRHLARLQVKVGALDIYFPRMLRPAALAAWSALAPIRGRSAAMPLLEMPPVIAAPPQLPPGYRQLGKQAIRIDMADKLIIAAHVPRMKAKGKRFAIDHALALSTGLLLPAFMLLLRKAGFVPHVPRPMAEGQFGPPTPITWRWRPPQFKVLPRPGRPDGAAFAALAELFS